MSALLAPSGECLRGEGLVWFIGAMVCSLAACRGFGPSVFKRVQLTAAFSAAAAWFLPINCHFDDCKARLVRFACKTRYIRITFSFNCMPQSLLLLQSLATGNPRAKPAELAAEIIMSFSPSKSRFCLLLRRREHKKFDL